MTVTCSDLPFRSLLYEVQHRSTFDSEWQVSAELLPTRGQGAGGSLGGSGTDPRRRVRLWGLGRAAAWSGPSPASRPDGQAQPCVGLLVTRGAAVSLQTPSPDETRPTHVKEASGWKRQSHLLIPAQGQLAWHGT